jgi:S-DNA-T family DNA segregation ATPase FtsK/SpoIIIE
VARSANVKQQPKEGLSEELKRRLREAGALLLMPLALYLLVCLLSYDARIPAGANAGQINHACNFRRQVGAHIADLLRWIFGYVPTVFPCCFCCWACRCCASAACAPRTRGNPRCG